MYRRLDDGGGVANANANDANEGSRPRKKPRKQRPCFSCTGERCSNGRAVEDCIVLCYCVAALNKLCAGSANKQGTNKADTWYFCWQNVVV